MAKLKYTGACLLSSSSSLFHFSQVLMADPDWSKAAGDGRADLPLFCIISPLYIWVRFYSTCKSFLGPGPWDGWQCGNGDFQESPSLEYYSLLEPLHLNFEGMFSISFYSLKGGRETIRVVQELPVKMLRIQWLSPAVPLCPQVGSCGSSECSKWQTWSRRAGTQNALQGSLFLF